MVALRASRRHHRGLCIVHLRLGIARGVLRHDADAREGSVHFARAMLRKLVEIQYERSEDLRRGTFRVRGDMIEIYPPYDDTGVRIEMWGSQIDAIRRIDTLTGEILTSPTEITRMPIYPKTHYVLP